MESDNNKPPDAPQDSFAVEPQPKAVTSDKPKSSSPFRDILSIFTVLGGAVVMAFFLISFVFQSYQVDGPSMQSTLQDQDHLIVWKVPKTIARITHSHYIPNRNDVIIFDLPASMNDGVEKQLIKRVIGLPGDRVVIKNGTVAVYNSNFPGGFNPDLDKQHGTLADETVGQVDLTVAENQVFVLGDHRKNSKESRYFGPISSDIIVGKLILRVLPLSKTARF